MSNEKFIRIIDIPHAMEIISERFDDALELMGNDDLVYGGAVRDIIAGLPIEGDLDIAVNIHTYHKIVAAFGSSPKWTMIGNKVGNIRPLPKKLPSRMPSRMSGVRSNSRRPSSLRGIPSEPEPNPYPPVLEKKLTRRGLDPYSGSDIVDTISFETFDSACVQIIRVNGVGMNQSDRLTSVLDLARNVDIRCCALALNSAGKVFELVDGAYIDCKDKVLNVCDIKDPDRFNNLKTRIQKLEQRGWTSKIDLMRTNAKLKALRNKMKKKQVKQTALKPVSYHRGTMEEYITIAADKGAYNVAIKKELGNLTHTNIDSEMEFLMRKRGVLASKFGENPEESLYSVSSVSHVSRIRDHFGNLALKTSTPAGLYAAVSKYQVELAEEPPIPQDPEERSGRVWSSISWGGSVEAPAYSDPIDIDASVEIAARLNEVNLESAEVDAPEIGRESVVSVDVSEIGREQVKMMAEGGRLENYKPLRTVHKAPPLTAELYKRNSAERRSEKLHERKLAERYDERRLNFSDYIKTRAKKAHKKVNDDF